MRTVRCDNKEQLTELLIYIFFIENQMEYERICQNLDITDSDLLPNVDVESNDPSVVELIDNLTTDHLKKFILDGKTNIQTANEFPIFVSWHFEDSFDRMGDVRINVFEWFTNESVGFEKFSKIIARTNRKVKNGD